MAVRTEVAGTAGAAALEAILAAALLLPGVTGTAARAQEAEDAASLQASRYRESPRPTGIAGGHGQPLAVDTRSLRVTLGAQGRDRLDLGYAQDTWSGATPVVTAPVIAGGNRAVPRPGPDGLVLSGASPMINGHLLLDAADRPVLRDPASGRLRDAPELVHTLSSASPETRQQLDLKFTRRMEGGSIALGGGVSLERDFQSRFVNLAGRIDRGGTTLTLGLSATRSTIAAALDHDAVPYLTRTAYASQIEARDGQQVLTGRRDDWAATASATQVLGPGALLSASLSGSGSRGYLANPYKATSVIFAAPGGGDGVRDGDLRALLEQRPGRRRQWGADGKLVLQQGASDAAWHIGLGASGDDWGVRARRAELEWWLPLAGDALFSARLRGYSQQAARFYVPYLVSRQAYRQISIGPDGQFVLTGYDPALLPTRFSSDTRLGAYGVLTAGLGYTAWLGRGAQLDVSIDTSLQSGRYAWGGNGDGRYADVRYRMIQASLKIDLEPRAGRAPAMPSSGITGAIRADEAGVPADLLPALAWPVPGEWRVGYRQQLSRSGGGLQAGSRTLDPADAAARACGGPCSAMPTGTTQQLQTVDVLVRLDAQRALLVAPQYRVNAMDSALVPGTDAGHAPVHLGSHESGALGDTQVHLFWQPAPGGAALWRWGLGLGIPTGHTTLAHRRVHQQDGTAMDYAMQTGTGTWDLLPSVTVRGGAGTLIWGAQATAALRLQARNRDGYAWGPGGQVTGWLGWAAGSGLAATVRAAWRVEPGVVGERIAAPAALSSPDDPANHGGRHVDLGLGVSMTGSAGTLSVEVVQPLRSWVRGVQPEPRTRWVIAIGRAL